jgi:hypothetical protein
VDDVAGYRVLRTAGHGERARLLIGFDEGHTVVLKVAGVDDPAVSIEIEALSRAAGDHVVALDDVASDARESVLVLERLPGGTLTELLERRGALEAGEAVTILAPLVLTLDRIHAAGVAHGGLSPSAICFRDDGAPVLTGFGRAELFGPGAPEVVRETIGGVVADRDALRAVTALVLGRVAGERAIAAHRLAEHLPDVSPDALGAALFGLATPAPVRFGADDVDPGATRLGEPQEAVAPDAEASAHLPPWILALLPDHLRDRVTEVLTQAHRLWSGWRPARRRLVLAAVAAGLTVFVAVALVPAGPAEPTSAPPTSSPSPVADSSESALPEDPVEAAVLLLEARGRCLRELSALCLDDVVQPGSAAYDDDVALIRAVHDGGEYPAGAIAAGTPVLVERLGDSALLDLPAGSEPSSILILRTTNGWRIRGYLENPAPEASAVSEEAGQIPRLEAKSPLSRRALTAPRKRAASAPSTMRWSYDSAR